MTAPNDDRASAAITAPVEQLKSLTEERRAESAKDTPSLAVVLSLAVIVFVVVTFGTILGSYLLMVHYVDAFSAHQMQVQIRAQVPVCKALRELARVKGSFSPGTTYGRHLASALRHVYLATRCPAILSGNYHPPK